MTDHRVETAQKRRALTRAKILDATMQVFARINDDAPVIEDVVREAGIARGTFYKHFRSLDEALIAAGTEANNRMIADIGPIYGFLKEPWQRASVGFRLFMVRAWQDPKWAAFVTRMDVWSHESLIAQHMAADFEQGKALGQFQIDDIRVTVDLVMGASASSLQAFRGKVDDPHRYMDDAVRMLLRALGCTPELQARAVSFSREHLRVVVSGERATWPRL